MKRLLIFSILLALIGQSFSQESKPFPTPADKPLWVMLMTYPSFPGNDTAICRYYTLLGDTVIGSKTYSKIYSLADTIVDSLYREDYSGAIRQELDTVFIVEVSESDEVVILDYSKGVLDTIPGLEGDVIISQIDTVLLNEEVYKRYNTNCGDKWIEGIGNTEWEIFGLCPPLPDNGSYIRLSCFKLDKTIIYGTDCQCIDPSGLNPPFYHGNGFKICPNPTKDHFYLNRGSNIQNQEIEMAVLDMSGKLISLQKIQMQSQYKKISVNDLKSGIYLLKITADGISYYDKLIIKE